MGHELACRSTGGSDTETVDDVVETGLEQNEQVLTINNIENGKALPSMTGFFYICEYLNITPGEFFDAENKNPEKIQEVVENLKKLDSEQLDNISAIIRDLAK